MESGKLLTRARAGDGAAFGELTDRHRGELQVHCYRFLGSLQDAEDLVQETLVAAWRGLDSFEGRGSLRAWLYRIATNRCLNVLRGRDRRPEGSLAGLGDRFTPPTTTSWSEPSWLEPLPDAVVEDTSPGPDARWESKESISLAFIVALQRLSPRQRAVLLLRDVLGFRAAEVADMLSSTEDSVNGLLRRARATLSEARRDAPRPDTDREREVADRFAEALHTGDLDTVLGLLTEDAVFTMPPEPYAWQGRTAVAAFLIERFRGHRFRFVPTTANGQPAFGLYQADPHARISRAHGLLVLTVADDLVSTLTRFVDSDVFRRFGLPRTVPS